VNLVQLTLKAAVLCDRTRTGGYWAVQCSLGSPILVHSKARVRLPVKE